MSQRKHRIGMTARILHRSSVRHDLWNVDSRNAMLILRETRAVLVGDPWVEEPPVGEFNGMFRLRAGDYRGIYASMGDHVLILGNRLRGEEYK